LTEEIVATPGWTDDRLDSVFATLPANAAVDAARNAYEACLAVSKSPAAPSDLLGSEFAHCRPALHQALRAAGVDEQGLSRLNLALEAVEAEIAAGS